MLPNNRFLVFFLWAIASNSVGFSQITPGIRTELSYDRDFYIIGLHNCHEHGLIVSTTQEPRKAERDPDRLFVLFDTNLIETQSLKVEVPFRQKITDTYQSAHVMYTLYYDNRFGDFTITGLDPSSDSVIRHSGKLPSKIEQQGFIVFGKYAVVGNFNRRKNELLIIDLKDGSYKSLSITGNLKRSEFEILDMRVFSDFSGMAIVAREGNRRNNRTYLLVLNEDGIEEKFLPVGDDDHTIVLATTDKMKNGEYVVTGTYSDLSVVNAQGMFVSIYNDSEQVSFNLKPFGDFNNFFDYMSRRGQESIERRKQRYEVRGKEMEVNVQMLIHPVFDGDTRYYLMGEVYQPTYRYTTHTTYINGRPSTTTTQVFDGYEYSHAAALTFDMAGTFHEDYCFPIQLGKKPYQLREVVNMHASDSLVKMAYMNYNTLRSKVISGAEEFQDSYDLQAGENQKIRYTSADVEFWYGSYFITSGYQNVKDIDGTFSRKKRDVFFLQKVEIH